MSALNIITTDSLRPDHYLGQGIDLGDKNIDFLISQGFPIERKPTVLIQGSFLFALKTKINQHVIGCPQPEQLDDKVIYLVRVQRSKGVPDQSSHLHPICQSIIDSSIAQVAPSLNQHPPQTPSW